MSPCQGLLEAFERLMQIKISAKIATDLTQACILGECRRATLDMQTIIVNISDINMVRLSVQFQCQFTISAPTRNLLDEDLASYIYRIEWRWRV